MIKTHCCENMKLKIGWDIIIYDERFDDYSFYHRNGGEADAEVHFCPFCGTSLPKSKRLLWIETLKKMGYENPYESINEIPAEYKTSEWYEKLENVPQFIEVDKSIYEVIPEEFSRQKENETTYDYTKRVEEEFYQKVTHWMCLEENMSPGLTKGKIYPFFYNEKEKEYVIVDDKGQKMIYYINVIGQYLKKC